MVLRNVSYSFSESTVYGVHGVNGSGKTMLLRMIAGLITPTAGRVYYNDKILHEDISFPKDVGIVIEHMEMLPGYSGYENLLLL